MRSKRTSTTQKTIRDEENPYALKTNEKGIKKNVEWNRMKFDVLSEIVELKFKTHDSLMAKLQSYSKANFYKATYDPIFGCGRLLADANQITTENIDQRSNRMGKILQMVRDKYRPATEKH